MTKEQVLNDFNEWLEIKIQEAKLPKLIEGIELIKPEGLVIEDIDVQDVSWKIPKDRGVIGIEMSFYTFHIKGIGPLQVFDESVGTEPFIGDFQCYYEDFETLIIDEVMDNEEIEVKSIEHFFNDLGIVNLLSHNVPDFFIQYVNQERESDRELVRNVTSEYYGLEFENVEFAGRNILLYTDKNIPIHTDSDDFSQMLKELKRE